MPPRPPQILICDDDSSFHLAVKQTLKGKYECRSAYNADEALVIVRKNPIDLLLLDVHIRSEDEGLRFIPKFVESDRDLAIVMSSGVSDFRVVREAMRLGALDYVVKDCQPDELLHAIERAFEKRALKRRSEQQNYEARQVQRQHPMVGGSSRIAELRRVIDRIRPSRANVVITGETGTGKEVVARQLRAELADGTLCPFVAVDSATIQSSTAESQLFGHEKGAFTGADQARKGIFEEANGGIVYFDEIANMPLEIQAKLLRVLQEKEITRLGSARVMQLDFRVICATNRDLEEMALQGLFKPDLLQRLSVLPLELPPLRERTEDIPDLVAHFLEKQGNGMTFTPEALEILREYSWPGNIRELGNLVAYVATMAEGPEIDVPDLPPKLRDPSRRRSSPASAGDFYARVAEFEKGILIQEYSRAEGNVSKLAMRLGMDRSHLYTKLKEYGIHLPKGAKGK